jgi:hypothetical protein
MGRRLATSLILCLQDHQMIDVYISTQTGKHFIDEWLQDGGPYQSCVCHIFFLWLPKGFDILAAIFWNR